MTGLNVTIDTLCHDVLYSGQARTPQVRFGAVACLPLDAHDWHVFCVKPGMATTAHRELEKQGFRTFRPSLVTKLVNNKPVWTELFGTYHFVQFRIEDGGWARVHYTYGVRRLLLDTSQKPATVPVDAMIQLLDHPKVYAPGTVTGSPDLIGETIEVLDGPWAPHRGLVVATATGRVTALMAIFGRDTRVEFPLGNIRRVS